jgi:DsbC/DsbD-like thiol-disulfide interchange protein
VWMFWLAGSAALAIAPSTLADISAPSNAPLHVTAAILSEQSALVPDTTATLGLDLTIEKKWHIYWNGRNDTGYAPSAEFTLPAGFTVDPIQWPAPVRHVDPGDLLNHVYFDHVTLLVPLHVPAAAKPGSSVTIKAKLAWMVCDESCVPEETEVELTLPVAKPGDKPTPSKDARKFADTRARLPKELAQSSKAAQLSWNDKAVELTVPDAQHLAFYPYEDCIPFASHIKDTDADGGKLMIHLGDPEPEHTALSGVLEVRRGKQSPPEFYSIHATNPKSPVPAARPASDTPPKAP